jgi:hypothetical protein
MKVLVKTLLIGGAIVLPALAAQPAGALEGGSSVYPNGAENYLVGALPPPGNYFLNYDEFYSADRFNGADGQKLYAHFSLTAFAEVARGVKVFNTTIFGASPFVAALLPAVDEHVDVLGNKGSTAGISELDLTEGLGWHLSPVFHVIAGVDEYMPMGNYSPTDLVSASDNRFAFEPVLAMTYLDPHGPEVDVKAMYDFNLKNQVTNYQSGEDFHFDYAVGYNVGLWTLGAGGYFEDQVTDDTVNGAPVLGTGFKSEGFAIGPDIQYKLGHNLLRLKWQDELIAHNKPQGSAVWLSFVVPL